ncbi:hypothetical protein F511_34175 [Dorcoceras hygrometricum]|uniref:Uncharacterized protein n=1 Tax=Dorcoceras hygrometricum TaxID=472368 RepID=A0A2Z7CA97_9LAMI|nr:hypothetical protein F511_34175 [Dorcoceras hygrometricum]
MAAARRAARNSAPRRRASLDSARPARDDRVTSARSSATHLQQRRPAIERAAALPNIAQRPAIERAAALPNRATICVRPPCLRRDQARDVPASMRDGRASARGGFRCGSAACGGPGQSMCDDISAVLI